MTCSSVKRISEWCIKPLHQLSPESNQPIHFTPTELRIVNINYTQAGLLFPKPPENQDFSITTFLDHLRRSLSATLVHFYPLAGRLATRKQQNPPSYVIYLDPSSENSPGAKFIYVDATVSDILNPNNDVVPSVVHSFFDLNEANNHDGHTLPLLSIQVTELVDGIFIGGSINHMVADGTSFWNFMAAWSEIYRSNDQHEISHPPIHKRWVLDGFDPIINLPYTHHDQFIDRSPKLKQRPFKEKLFHLSSPSVFKLKTKANSEANTDNNNNNNNNKISSFQAVVALLWRCITRVRRLPHDTQTTCRLVMCIRRRLDPPLSNEYFGNYIQTVYGTATVGDLMAHGLGWAALRLHEVVTNHGDTAVKERVESWIRSPVIYKVSQLVDPNAIHVGSSPRFDMYGCEFGLGKAVAARTGGTNKFDGKITMYPGREGGGSMDVEVCFGSSQHMMDIECDHEFINALSL